MDWFGSFLIHSEKAVDLLHIHESYFAKSYLRLNLSKVLYEMN